MATFPAWKDVNGPWQPRWFVITIAKQIPRTTIFLMRRSIPATGGWPEGWRHLFALLKGWITRIGSALALSGRPFSEERWGCTCRHAATQAKTFATPAAA